MGWRAVRQPHPIRQEQLGRNTRRCEIQSSHQLMVTARFRLILKYIFNGKRFTSLRNTHFCGTIIISQLINTHWFYRIRTIFGLHRLIN